MAPSRRKGRAAAAAAVAARQQWKVGDLVLAKMKGFPPWPAEISEPQKWGYSSDKKKLFVYFFGTKQIAFCNHADVEVFTEEKKNALLLKRQGKGTDFVRAVDEIVDSFEKLKEQKINDAHSSGDEAIESDVGKMECSSINSCKTSPQESQPTSNCQPETICTSMQCNGSRMSEEVSVNLTEDVTIQNNGITHEQSNGNVSILDQLRKTPLGTVGSLRKRSRDSLSQTSDVQKRVPSVWRSRSSMKADSCNLQKTDMQVEADSCGNDLVSDVLLAESLLHNKVIRKSTIVHETNSEVSSLAPNMCDDSGSRNAAVELGAHPPNEGCTVELNCKAEARIEGKGLAFNGSLDIQRKMVVLRKKRKPNKKRFDQEVAAHAKLEKETFLLPEPSKNLPILSGSCQSVHEQHNKTDGDEHLPLVKRARVRMGNLPEERKLDDLIGTVEKSEKEALVNCALNISSNSGNNHIVNEALLNSVKAFDGASPSYDDMWAKEHDTVPWKGNKYPLRCSAVDVEAALPPSKRLHRALEAMCANAAEASHDRLEDSNSIYTSPDDNSNHSEMGCCLILLDGKSNPRESHVALSPDTKGMSTSMSGMPSSFASQISQTSIGSSSEVKHDEILSLQSMDCKGQLIDVKVSKDSSDRTVTTELQNRSPRPSCIEARDNKVNVVSGHSELETSPSPVIEGSTKEMLQLGEELPLGVKNDDNSPILELESENGSRKPVSENGDCILKPEVVCDFLPLNGTDTIDSYMDEASISSNPSGDVKSSGFLSDEKCEGNVQEVAVGVKHNLIPKGTCFSPDSTPMKVLIAAAQAKRLFPRSGSLSENINCKLVPDVMLRPSIFHKEKSANKHSPPNSFISHIPTFSEETNGLQSGSRSPVSNMQLKNSIHLMDVDEIRFDSASTLKQKSLNKCVGQAEAYAARKSFETLLSTLSRTKESIGRATRLAIDCAKYGIASEVVQILLQNLEKELSLNRRLDLFFLVDSITQCSRGQKGVAGDAYPSLVQSVLPRLLSAAAPPGNAAWDNRRQCLKVLRLWLERKTLPESTIRHHIRELESVNEASFSTGSSRRLPRTERPLNDPVREMEGMLVDEYGSNASFQIPGFLGSRMLDDDEDESADDEKSFETVTPERGAETCKEAEATMNSIPEKHTHILEDVDGELEMEDVSPPRDTEMSSMYDSTGVSGEHPSHHRQLDKHVSFSFAPPLPADNPPSPPPLPSSPPPVDPSCPSILSLVPPSQSTVSHNCADTSESHPYMSRTNMQYPLCSRQPSTPSANVMQSDRVECYAPVYVDHPKQMQLPVPSFNSSSSYGYLNGSHPSGHSANDNPRLTSGPLSNKGYHLQPPPVTISNQFAHVQSEKPPIQTWGDSSSPFDRRVTFATETQGGHFHGNRPVRGPVQHDSSDRCRLSAAVHSGPVPPEKVEASPNLLGYYRPPAEASSIPRHGWSAPPRNSTYRYSLAATRPPLENHVSRVAGARDYWRPR